MKKFWIIPWCRFLTSLRVNPTKEQTEPKFKTMTAKLCFVHALRRSQYSCKNSLRLAWEAWVNFCNEGASVGGCENDWTGGLAGLCSLGMLETGSFCGSFTRTNCPLTTPFKSWRRPFFRRCWCGAGLGTSQRRRNSWGDRKRFLSNRAAKSFFMALLSLLGWKGHNLEPRVAVKEVELYFSLCKQLPCRRQAAVVKMLTKKRIMWRCSDLFPKIGTLRKMTTHPRMKDPGFHYLDSE